MLSNTRATKSMPMPAKRRLSCPYLLPVAAGRFRPVLPAVSALAVRHAVSYPTLPLISAYHTPSALLPTKNRGCRKASAN